MNAKMFRKALDLLGFNQVEFAKFLCIGDRTVRHYAEDGVTNYPTVLLLNMMLLGIIKKADIEKAKLYTKL